MAEANFQEIELEEQRNGDVEQVVNVALVGETGRGKSSFVNAITRLKDDDEMAAPTGVTNTTAEPGCYALPDKPNFKLWDLPGYNTLNVPNPKIYCEKHYLKEYDAFLLFTNERFTENDLVLAKRIQSLGKPFFIIRTKIDVDFRNEDLKESFNEEEMLETIRKDILKSVKDLHCSGEEVFLISNVLRDSWDFPRLTEKRLYELSSPTNCYLPRLSKQLKFAQLHNIKIDKKTMPKFLKKHWSEVGDEIRKRGIEAAQQVMRKRLEQWKEVKISLAIIGFAGGGKSSFINKIRGLENDDEEAAKTGVVETTLEPEAYPYPTNPNITLWDQPGIGTIKFPNLKTYCQRVKIETYDTFIIITATRFTDYDVALAKKLASINKPFFLVRTKIDVDYTNERTKKKFNEEAMLNQIREDCSSNLKGLEVFSEKDIFLISNNHPRKWDFARLTKEITEKLSFRKQDSFCLSMYILSEEILKRKVDTLRSRIWMATLPSVIVKMLPGTKLISREIDFKIIVEKVEFYRSQLGFPDKDSEEYQGMADELQERVQKFYLTNEMDVKVWLKQFDDGDEEEEEEVLGPSYSLLDADKAIEAPFKFVYRSLYCALDEMGEIALAILKEATERPEPKVDID